MDVEVMKDAWIWCQTIDCESSVAWLLIVVFTAAKMSPRQAEAWIKIDDESKNEWLIRLPHLGSCGTVCVLIICAVLTNQARGQSEAVEWCPYRPAAPQDCDVNSLPPTCQTTSTTPVTGSQAQTCAPSNNGSSPDNLNSPPVFVSPTADTWDPYSTQGASQRVDQWLAPPPLGNCDPYLTRPSSSQSAGKDSASTQASSGSADRSPFRYRLMWEPAQPVQGQPTELGMVEHDLSFKFPLWVSGPDVISFSGGVCADLFQTDAVLPDSGRAFPEELWNIRAGINYMRRFDNGWTGGATLTIGSACDQPFESLRDMDVTAVAFLRMPRGEHDAWKFSLVYAPMSQIPFPIPLVAYQWHPSDMFNMDIGLPFKATYRPTESLTFDVSYMLLTTVNVKATYQLCDSWQVYGAFDWEYDSWFLHDREDYKERLFSYDMRLSTGVRTTYFQKLTVDLSTGYMFDRFYFTGQDYNDRNHDRLNIGSGVYASLEASLRF
jgi:hypothetical protein